MVIVQKQDTALVTKLDTVLVQKQYTVLAQQHEGAVDEKLSLFCGVRGAGIVTFCEHRATAQIPE